MVDQHTRSLVRNLERKTHPSKHKRPTALSVELIELVADFLFQLQVPNFSDNVEQGTICCKKPHWNEVQGFMYASPELHRIGYIRWVVVLTIRSLEDWDIALSTSLLVREIICLDGAFSPQHQAVLSGFPQLRAVSVDSHDDVRRLTMGANRFAYQDIFTSLPRSLRYLEIKHAHGPDVNVIASVKRDCPNLETLWLGRCTAFNRTPACQFWASFPFDHDSYISNEGTDTYAYSLGQELSSLRDLKSLRVGVYLMPSTAVLAHRLYHVRNLPAPQNINWQGALAPHPNANQNEEPQPQTPQISDLVTLLHQAPEPDVCERCRQESFTATQVAEASASRILKEAVPGLRCIEWMDWFTPSHLGVSSHQYKK